MEHILHFSYDKNAHDHRRDELISILKDIKGDKLTDKEMAEGLLKADYSESDVKELINFINAAFVKSQEEAWQEKKYIIKILGIDSRTFDRFKAKYSRQLQYNFHYKKINGKTYVYHSEKFIQMYNRFNNVEDEEKLDEYRSLLKESGLDEIFKAKKKATKSMPKKSKSKPK